MLTYFIIFKYYFVVERFLLKKLNKTLYGKILFNSRFNEAGIRYSSN